MGKKHCKVCHARGLNIGPDGRCLGCRMALLASCYGVRYGHLMAMLRDRGVRAEDLDPTGLPPVADRRKHWR